MQRALDALAKATHGTPFEGTLWVVGGAVRDPLLGRAEPTDIDLVTELSAVDVAEFLHAKGASSIHPVTYPRFGTALVRVDDTNVEIVTARSESYAPESRKPDVRPATLEEDARRRDFTVNTLLRNVHSGELRDPLGTGLADLDAKLLRTPLDPAETFRDDPLRMLRTVRFRWQLGFQPVEGLYDTIRSERHRLAIVSAERVRDEFVRMLGFEDADRCLADLMDLGLFDERAPEFTAMRGVEQGSYHHLDVWDHTLLVVKNIGTGDLVLRLAALLHDVGKPPTRFIDAQGATRFFGHETVGADMAEALLRRFKFSNEQIAPVVRLVKNHMRLGSAPTLTRPAARRIWRDLGEDTPRLLDLVEADASALKPGVRVLEVGPIRAFLENVRAEIPPERLKSPLDGDAVMELLGLEPGPEVGRWLRVLQEAVLDGHLDPDDEQRAKRWLLEAN